MLDTAKYIYLYTSDVCSCMYVQTLGEGEGGFRVENDVGIVEFVLLVKFMYVLGLWRGVGWGARV